jgi:hypothetical protein
LVVLTTPDDQRWPFCCANHTLTSKITKSRWSTSEAPPQTAEVRTIVIGKPQRAIGYQGEFTQGPAVCQTDRRRPLRQGPIGFPSGWPLRKWLVRQRVC